VFSKLCSIAAICCALMAVAQVRFPARVAPSGGSGSLLTTEDLDTCVGVFKTPGMATGTPSVGMPVTLKEFNGTSRVYLIYDGTGDVLEFIEPTLSACNTAIASMNTATYPGWGGNWGSFDVQAEGGFIPGSQSTLAHGLYYDSVTSKLVLNWATNYAGGTFSNTVATATMDSGTHTLTVTGCYKFSDHPPPQTGLGLTIIPDAFVTANLPAGRRWALLGGNLASQENSMGPTLTAVAPPADNDCDPNTSYPLTNVTTPLSLYLATVGPTCDSGDDQMPDVGCTPSQAPTAPYAAKQLFADYSMTTYGWAWTPYAGQGWWTTSTGGRIGWYDDGVKHGVIVPYHTPSGWLNTTVSASTTPTGTQFTATSIDMHDGSNLNVNDGIWIETCTIGVDGAGCEQTNQKNLSTSYVTAIDTGTKLVTYGVMSADFGSGNHLPVVGGKVLAGCIYAHGGQHCSRGIPRLQVYDPAQYAEVAASTRELYDVQYTDEADMSAVWHHFGSPAAGGGVNQNAPIPGTAQRFVNAIIPDPDRQQYIVFMNGAESTPSSMAYVMSVDHSAPDPMPFPVLPLAAGAALWTVGRGRRG
jgi:hypothetical protein